MVVTNGKPRATDDNNGSAHMRITTPGSNFESWTTSNVYFLHTKAYFTRPRDTREFVEDISRVCESEGRKSTEHGRRYVGLQGDLRPGAAYAMKSVSSRSIILLSMFVGGMRAMKACSPPRRLPVRSATGRATNDPLSTLAATGEARIFGDILTIKHVDTAVHRNPMR
jgi:hypothetical protein